MIKLIAIDMDGTLLNESHLITNKVKKALHEAIEAGIKIVLCTGRPLKAIYPYLEELEMAQEEDYVISLNGALIQKTNTQEIVYKQTLSHEDLVKIEKLRKDVAEINFSFFDETHYFYTGEPTEVLKYDAHLLGMELNSMPVQELPEDRTIYKSMFVGEEAVLDHFVEHIPDFISEEYYPIRSLSYVFEVLPKHANKGTALLGLAEKLGFDHEEIMAIGDGENDIDMIEAAGHSVAMGNATATIKKAAKYETKSNEEDGVAHAIYKWALNQNA
ncbi:Cof-type HAD-IIB family hydrolase [Carnobacterium antarcticum]|uniref:Cof-type HAD-IIB family hydrolase n=1 Tax=Carnobacterium antarcticum TaxID=2126436 RepID=A0ABW4NK36_9LACT|nr:Cof-type HAD-IIB family hydrolase [Carnobacterium sp. CP1]ALV21459.1 Phosphatase YidA [Carnobacterium sp. CP1]